MARRKSSIGSEISGTTAPTRRRGSSTVSAQRGPDPPPPSVPTIPCSTLLEDGTPCNLPGTNGDPKKAERRCRRHNEDYQNSYLHYKAASEAVDSIKAEGRIPTEGEIRATWSLFWLAKMIDWLDRYRDALYDELTGRREHTTRFFPLSTPHEGHLNRCGILQERISRVEHLLECLHRRRHFVTPFTPEYSLDSLESSLACDDGTSIILEDDETPLTHLELFHIGLVEDDGAEENELVDWSWYESAESYNSDTSYYDVLDDLPSHSGYVEHGEHQDDWRDSHYLVPSVVPGSPVQVFAASSETSTKDNTKRNAGGSKRPRSRQELFPSHEPWLFGSKVLVFGVLALAGGALLAMKSYQFKHVIKGVFDNLKARA